FERLDPPLKGFQFNRHSGIDVLFYVLFKSCRPEVMLCSDLYQLLGDLFDVPPRVSLNYEKAQNAKNEKRRYQRLDHR
ncbi:MAG TPA: hypothetical protein VGU01_06790, partial [Sphingomicrobium sp.]|nr:hypothetical protein [Sphingomicrobium sp.]